MRKPDYLGTGTAVLIAGFLLCSAAALAAVFYMDSSSNRLAVGLDWAFFLVSAIGASWYHYHRSEAVAALRFAEAHKPKPSRTPWADSSGS